jgi:hypothetical protein
MIIPWKQGDRVEKNKRFDEKRKYAEKESR